MLRKYTLISAVALLLCVLLTTPPILSATVNKENLDAIIKVETTSAMKTLQVLDNMTLPYKENTKIDYFGNGTKKASISLNFTEFGKGGICVSMQTMIQPTWARETESETSVKNYDYSAQTSGLYPYVDQWDTLNFLLPGNNGSCIVSYSHNNNYDSRGYYPGLWYLPFKLPDALYPAANAIADHIHIPADVMADWLNGVTDRRTVIGMVMGLAGGVMAVITGIVAILFNPVAAIAAIIAGISSIIGWMLSWFARDEQQWKSDTVQEKQSGDGWTWTWGAKLVDSFAWIFRPPIWTITSQNDVRILERYHRVGIGVRNTMEFQQSWGADRDSPQTYTVDAWGEFYENGGAFGGTRDISI